MVKIIGISGRKQSGKSTAANFINGHVLKSRSMIDDFIIQNDGKLKIKTTNQNGEKNWGIFDVTRKDDTYIEYAERELWPYIKIYHFADYLKSICVNLFDLKPEQVYGTDNQKNTLTPYGMTAREFLQYFGTDVMRKIKDTIWVDHTIKTILREQPEIAIIPDVRFPNEVHAIKNSGGLVVRLNRNVFNSDHHCESALDYNSFDWNMFDLIIDNKDLSIDQLCEELDKNSYLWKI